MSSLMIVQCADWPNAIVTDAPSCAADVTAQADAA